MHQRLDQCGGGGVQGGALAARMWFGSDVPGRAGTASQLLDKCKTDPEEVREGALGAKPALTCLKNFVS